MLSLLIPNLPTTEQLLPWLQRIDHAKWYTNFGPLIQEFESKLIKLFAPPSNIYLTTTSSGTTALELALLALNLPPNQVALLPAFTFPATATAIQRVGLRPLFTDIDKHNWLLTPDIARQVLQQMTFDIVVPVATFGCPQPVDEWDKFSEETGIPVLIDAAAAFGFQAIGQHCLVTFSFHATKPFGIGEGGLVVARSESLINRIRNLSNFGIDNGIIMQSGNNAKLSEYHAAVGLAQLERWTQIIESRQTIWQTYKKYLPILSPKLSWQNMPANTIPATLSIKLDNVDIAARMMNLEKCGIETRRWYYPPLYKQPAFSEIQLIAPDGSHYLTVTEKIADCLLGLPFHTYLKEDNIKYICNNLMLNIVIS